MAARPKSICRKVACGTLVDAPGYCTKHAKQASGWVRSHGDQTSAQRGYGYDWRQCRQWILKRDCGICQINGDACTVVAGEVDHKVNKATARAHGWTDDQIEADSTCHRAKTRAQRGGGG